MRNQRVLRNGFEEEFKIKTFKVYGHLQQIHLQRPGFCGTPEFRQVAAKPLAAKANAATFLTLSALLLTAGHLQQVICSKIGHFQRK